MKVIIQLQLRHRVNRLPKCLSLASQTPAETLPLVIKSHPRAILAQIQVNSILNVLPFVVTISKFYLYITSA